MDTRKDIEILTVFFCKVSLKSGMNCQLWVHSLSMPIFKNKVITSVLKIPFLVGPGRYGFQRAGTRVLAPMGDNR